MIPSRSAGDEVILQYPLNKVFSVDRSLIIGTVLLIQACDIFWACCRCNTIYHAVRESDIIRYPFEEFWILFLNERRKHTASCVTIMLQIITRQDSYWTVSCCLSSAKAFSNKSKCRFRNLWLL